MFNHFRIPVYVVADVQMSTICLSLELHDKILSLNNVGNLMPYSIFDLLQNSSTLPANLRFQSTQNSQVSKTSLPSACKTRRFQSTQNSQVSKTQVLTLFNWCLLLENLKFHQLLNNDYITAQRVTKRLHILNANL